LVLTARDHVDGQLGHLPDLFFDRHPAKKISIFSELSVLIGRRETSWKERFAINGIDLRKPRNGQLRNDHKEQK
jgi:hypothetical protein